MNSAARSTEKNPSNSATQKAGQVSLGNIGNGLAAGGNGLSQNQAFNNMK